MKLAALLVAVLAMAFASSAHAAPATGDFLVACPVHTISHDDPIVFPGQPGVNHEHAFAGAQPIDAFSFFGNMLEAGTSCMFPGNKSGVWTPVIISPTGERVYPLSDNLYYRGTGREASTLYPFPLGLQHIRHDITGYRCTNSNITRGYIPTDCGGAGIEMSTYFPQCWTGREVTGDPLGPCDADHPVNVPQLQVLTSWPPQAVGGQVDPEAGHMHVDYLEGWNPYALDDIMRGCLHANIKCRVRSTGEVFDFGTKAVVIPAGTYH